MRSPDATTCRLFLGVTAAATVSLLAGCSSSSPAAQQTAPPAASTVAPPTTTSVSATSKAPTPTTASVPATSNAPTSTTVPSAAAVTTTTMPPSGGAVPAAGTVPSDAPTTTNAGCGALAARSFIHVLSVESGPDDSLFVHGNPATLHCGGADDSQLNVDTTRTETGELLADATVQVFPISSMRTRSIHPSQLAAYLAGDEDTRTFLITGPLTGMTGLQEQYHP